MSGPFKLKSGNKLKDFFISVGANLKRNRRDIAGENKGIPFIVVIIAIFISFLLFQTN